MKCDPHDIDCVYPERDVLGGVAKGHAENNDLGAYLHDAFRLAYFIHPEVPWAMHATVRSLALVDVMATHQDKRRYVKPRRHRTKVSKSRPQLLQDLICCLSLERTIQQPPPHDRTDPDDLLIRFVVLLVRIGSRRSSFYINLCISRILHDYTTPQARALYDLLQQDPERMRHGAYYRRCKRVLMEEVRQHLGHVVGLCRAPRGELRLVSQPPSDRQAVLVKQCLELLTPWQTRCSIPQAFDPMRQDLPELCFSGSHPDDEHPIDMRRAHGILHPACFARLTRALGLDSPDERLRIPSFTVAGDGPGGPPRPGARRDRRAPELTVEDRLAIGEQVRAIKERRRRWSLNRLGRGP